MTYVLVKFIFTFTAAGVYTWSSLELVISQECALYCVFGFQIPQNYLASTHTRQTTLPALWSKYPPCPAGIYSTADPFKELSGFGGKKCFKMQQTQCGQVIIVNWFSAEREMINDVSWGQRSLILSRIWSWSPVSPFVVETRHKIPFNFSNIYIRYVGKYLPILRFHSYLLCVQTGRNC